MSIKTQTIIKFIPIVNLIIMFLWLRTCSVYSVKPFDFVKEFLKIVAICSLISAIQIIFSFAFQNDTLDGILALICGYFYSLIIAWISIMAQEKILYSNSSKEENENVKENN